MCKKYRLSKRIVRVLYRGLFVVGGGLLFCGVCLGLLRKETLLRYYVRGNFAFQEGVVDCKILFRG